MTATFVIILLAAFASAWGTRAAWLAGGAWGWRVFSAVLFALLGVHAVILAALSGDGIVFPGLQLSPEVTNMFGAEFAAGRVWWAPRPLLSLVVLLAHLAILLAKTNRSNWLRPLPATMLFVFVTIFYRGGANLPARQYLRSVGPQTNGYLTIVPTGDGADLIFAVGNRGEVLLDIVHRHEADKLPPKPLLQWTRDGAAILLSVRLDRLFAVEKDGSYVGWLPPRGSMWPPEKNDPGYEPVDNHRMRSQGQRDVAEYLNNHAGIWVEKP